MRSPPVKLLGGFRPVNCVTAHGNKVELDWIMHSGRGSRRPGVMMVQDGTLPFKSASSRLANTGSYFAFSLAYFLFALMVLFQIADLAIAIIRVW